MASKTAPNSKLPAPDLSCAAHGKSRVMQIMIVVIAFGFDMDTVRRRFAQLLDLGGSAWGSSANRASSLADFVISDTILKHRLTEAERQQFETQGFLVVPGALEPTEITALNDAFYDWYSQYNDGAQGSEFFGYLFPAPKTHDMAERHPKLVETVANPRTLGKVYDILGWNIRSYHAHMTFKEGVDCSSNTSRCASLDDVASMWHQDGGRIQMDVTESHPRPRLSLKVGFHLADTTDLGAPSMWVVPGSHHSVINTTYHKALKDAKEAPPGAVPVRVKAGSAVIFDRRIWHSGPPNRNYSKPRKILFFGYAHRWLQSKDPMATSDILRHARDPVLRQLLGHHDTYNGLYSPAPDDVPLREWMEARESLSDKMMAWDYCTKDIFDGLCQ